jgi:hypothetical protein
MLAEQEVPATLYVWNNNRREARQVDSALVRSPIPAESIHCSRNIGGFGRFYVARDLAHAHDAALFIDDDQVFGPAMVADQLASFDPESLAGWWAFTFRPGARCYAERDRVETPLAPADYVGTGGMVADTAIFTDRRLYDCPRRYWFGVEDLWLSYYTSHVRGWRLRRSLAEFEFEPDGQDIDLTLAPTKVRMFRYLQRRGWNVGSITRERLA